MRSLWNRARQLVSGSRRSEERLPVAVDALHYDPDYSPRNDAISRGDTDYVLRLLYRYTESTDSGSGPVHTQVIGLGPGARAVPRNRDASVRYNVTYTFGPYDAEDFAPTARYSDCE